VDPTSLSILLIFPIQHLMRTADPVVQAVLVLLAIFSLHAGP